MVDSVQQRKVEMRAKEVHPDQTNTQEFKEAKVQAQSKEEMQCVVLRPQEKVQGEAGSR